MIGFVRWLFGAPTASGSRQTTKVTIRANITIDQPAREFHSKVTGVSHTNIDGVSRQDIIRDLSVGTPLLLKPEPDNPFDPNAIALLTPGGVQVGYVRSELAAELRSQLLRGDRVEIAVSEITGGTRSKPIRGVNYLIQVWSGSRASRR